jgi:hypothetical protein
MPSKNHLPRHKAARRDHIQENTPIVRRSMATQQFIHRLSENELRRQLHDCNQKIPPLTRQYSTASTKLVSHLEKHPKLCYRLNQFNPFSGKFFNDDNEELVGECYDPEPEYLCSFERYSIINDETRDLVHNVVTLKRQLEELEEFLSTLWWKLMNSDAIAIAYFPEECSMKGAKRDGSNWKHDPSKHSKKSRKTKHFNAKRRHTIRESLQLSI